MESSEPSNNLEAVESSQSLTITEAESDATQNQKPKRKYKRRKSRKSRKSSRRQNQNQNLDAGGSISSSFEAVASGIPDTIGVTDGGAVDPAAIAAAAPVGSGTEIFETQVEFYLPRFFNAMAYLMGEHWNLDEMETRIAVPLGAKSLEEIYPFLPDWIRDAKFKATWAFGATMAVMIAPRANKTWELYKQRKAQEEIANNSPAGTESDTSTRVSPASSGFSVNLESAKPFLRVDS
jgi:cobalamin-dependent methionine synthase I